MQREITIGFSAAPPVRDSKRKGRGEKGDKTVGKSINGASEERRRDEEERRRRGYWSEWNRGIFGAASETGREKAQVKLRRRGGMGMEGERSGGKDLNLIPSFSYPLLPSFHPF